MQIIDDKRTIKSLTGIDVSETNYQIGYMGVTKIEPYIENGEMAPVIWFKVWVGDFLRNRVRGGSIESIQYVEKP